MFITSNGTSLRIVERAAYRSVYGIIATVFGIVATLLGLARVIPQDFFLIGAFFLICGVLVIWTAESKITECHDDGSCKIKYLKHFSKKQISRTLNRNDLLEIKLVTGRNMGNVEILQTLYITLLNGEDIEIGQRLHQTKEITKVTDNLTKEALVISNYLKINLNYVNMLSLQNSLNNAFTPKDIMKAPLQRPTQEIRNK